MLAIRKSTIPGANLGVFADEEIPKGANLGIYNGELIGVEEYENIFKTTTDVRLDYALQITSRIILLPTYEQLSLPNENPVLFINDAKIFKLQNAKLVVDTVRKRARVKTKRVIRKGEEIFMSYGPKYWKDRTHSFPEQ